MTISLATLNQMTHADFVRTCAGLFEHSPWIPERTWPQRPFQSREDLHAKLLATLAASTREEKLALIRAHPDLVGKLAKEGRLTTESTAEQASAGLINLRPQDAALFERYNAAYRERFGFPFVICARENKKAAILAAFPKRLEQTQEAEIETALSEIAKIARLRLFDLVQEH